MKTPRMYYGALAMVCVITLCIGFASAAGTTQATHTSTCGKGIVHPAFDLTNATVQHQIIARYEQEGVDVTALAAAFQSGNSTDVKSWLEVHRPARPEFGNKTRSNGFDMTNTTVQQEILTRYQNQGVDTTGLAAAFMSGNNTGVKSWLGVHRLARPEFGNKTSSKGFDMTNTTVQQEILTRYQNQGVDTTGLAAAFQNGDTAAVKSWFDAYFKAHPQTQKGQSGRSEAAS